jgi:predicted RNA binding protein YcfA (HicA-like mRNA interferase family)
LNEQKGKTSEQDPCRQSGCNISFTGLCSLLASLGFEERIEGSHHVFVKEGTDKMLNLQKEGANAKPYQVKQVRELLKELNIAED